jgi:hypothetical protein
VSPSSALPQTTVLPHTTVAAAGSVTAAPLVAFHALAQSDPPQREPQTTFWDLPTPH